MHGAGAKTGHIAIQHNENIDIDGGGKFDYEFVSHFGALASTFGRPGHPRQPPAKQELPQAFVKTKVSENFRENYRNSFGPSFAGMACQTLFFRILPAPKNTLFCLCFGAPRIFSKPRFSTNPIFGLAVGPFFRDFRPNCVFQISARSENTPILPVIWCLSNFFKTTIFDLTPFLGSPSGRFSPIFGQTVFFRFPPGPKIPRFCL